MKNILILLTLIIYSCGIHNNIVGKKYETNKGKKKISISFESYSEFILKREYSCENSPSIKKELIIKGKWKLDKIKLSGYTEKFKGKSVFLPIIIINNYKILNEDKTNLDIQKESCSGLEGSLHKILKSQSDTIIVKDNFLIYKGFTLNNE